MKKILILVCISVSLNVFGQNYQLKTGETFPDINFRPIINAPFAAFNLKNQADRKIYIINFWGTWCSPCIPEMDALAKIQAKYRHQIQIIGLSNDAKTKLVKYAVKRPSKIWLASDTASLLYRMLDLSFVGQAIIVNAKHQIIGVYKTNSINDILLKSILAGKVPPSDGEIKGRPINSNSDPFGIDSNTVNSFTIRGYMAGQTTMGKRPNSGPFAFRRITFFNLPVSSFYRDAYGINSDSQVIFEADKNKYENFDDKSQNYCVDLVVPKEDKDNLMQIFQRRLNETLPLKGRVEMKDMQVYILKLKDKGDIAAPRSALKESSVKYSGNGFDGKGVSIKEFADDYLTNEFNKPVIDETGLTGRYDIKTSNDIRDEQNIVNAMNKLGLTLEKAERKVKILVLYEDRK